MVPHAVTASVLDAVNPEGLVFLLTQFDGQPLYK
jgi:hypothetical protein